MGNNLTNHAKAKTLNHHYRIKSNLSNSKGKKIEIPNSKIVPYFKRWEDNILGNSLSKMNTQDVKNVTYSKNSNGNYLRFSSSKQIYSNIKSPKEKYFNPLEYSQYNINPLLMKTASVKELPKYSQINNTAENYSRKIYRPQILIFKSPSSEKCLKLKETISKIENTKSQGKVNVLNSANQKFGKSSTIIPKQEKNFERFKIKLIRIGSIV